MNLSYCLLLSFWLALVLSSPDISKSSINDAEEAQDWIGTPSQTSIEKPCMNPCSCSHKDAAFLQQGGWIKASAGIKVKAKLKLKVKLPKVKMCSCPCGVSGGISLKAGIKVKAKAKFGFGAKLKLGRLGASLKAGFNGLKKLAGKLKFSLGFKLKAPIPKIRPQPAPLASWPPLNPIRAPPLAWTCCRICPHKYMPSFDSSFGVTPRPLPVKSTKSKEAPLNSTDTVMPPTLLERAIFKAGGSVKASANVKAKGSVRANARVRAKARVNVKARARVRVKTNFKAKVRVRSSFRIRVRAKASFKLRLGPIKFSASLRIGRRRRPRRRRRRPRPKPRIPQEKNFNCCPICPGYGTPTMMSPILLEEEGPFNPVLPPCCNFCEEIYFSRVPYAQTTGLPDPIVSLTDVEKGRAPTDSVGLGSSDDSSESTEASETSPDSSAPTAFLEDISDLWPASNGDTGERSCASLTDPHYVDVVHDPDDESEASFIEMSRSRNQKPAQCCHFCPNSCATEKGKRKLYLSTNIRIAENEWPRKP